MSSTLQVRQKINTLPGKSPPGNISIIRHHSRLMRNPGNGPLPVGVIGQISAASSTSPLAQPNCCCWTVHFCEPQVPRPQRVGFTLWWIWRHPTTQQATPLEAVAAAAAATALCLFRLVSMVTWAGPEHEREEGRELPAGQQRHCGRRKPGAPNLFCSNDKRRVHKNKLEDRKSIWMTSFWDASFLNKGRGCFSRLFVVFTTIKATAMKCLSIRLPSIMEINR